ncbi:MAG: hypothetical protein AAB583_03860, partial [Patescibacteria group bacterium]
MKLFKPFIISLILVFGYLTLISYPYFFSKINRYDSLGFLSLVEEKSVNMQKTFSQERSTDQFDNHLLKGEKVKARIKASENNFGILLFRFAKLSSKVSDSVVFRIKKEGEEKWYYEKNYKANQFQPDQYFTFGFPPFKNSKNNTYVFEIESLSGTYKNGIGVSLNGHKVALVYRYSLNDLKNYDTLFSFIFKKFFYAVRNVNVLQYWEILSTFVLSLLLALFVEKKKVIPNVVRFLQLLFMFFIKKVKISFWDIVRFLPTIRTNSRRMFKVIMDEAKFNYLSLEKEIVNFSKRTSRGFSRTKFYSLFLNSNTKKRITIGLLIFLLALIYRFSSALVHLDKLFYAGLGGQGDYDQFIRAATCAIRNF